MGNLALKLAKAVPELGRSVIQNYASNAISSVFRPQNDGQRYTELSLQTSTEGRPVPIVYGRMRIAGQVIWAARFKETAQSGQNSGGKAGRSRSTDYSYSVSFAIGLCDGPINAMGQVWANGELLDLTGLNYQLYNGSDDQDPDPLMQAVEGVDQVPAYRGLAYIVFEDFPLDEFGLRIPNLSFEIVAGLRLRQDTAIMEELVQGVCLIPASGEFTYSDIEVLREVEPGRDVSENRHNLRAETDLEAALDDLQTRLPKCKSVALVTSWFGDDLRCGHCLLKPGVESRIKDTRPLVWQSAGLNRTNAHLVSQKNKAPVYGGTPSDETIIAAIKALKARGFSVTLYPFILMDIPQGNGLPDPYGSGQQAVFPWRGRITCHPAPEHDNSPDKTAASIDQVDDFFGLAQPGDFQVKQGRVIYSGPDEWRFNRFILHHAALAAAAGGVESMIIGSEMRGLTQIRSAQEQYPSVDRLVTLAQNVRKIVGSGVKLSYAADWSEYWGHTPFDGSGDRYFHLDPLWALSDIDYVGIDWYVPLSDWRDGLGHLDRLNGAGSIYERAYLASQMEGGEGYDWYYADAADRDRQVRTPISDGAYNEPWVWRYKDIRNWWSKPHYNRTRGVRELRPTAWRPEGKPIRFVELGCPAVDKGANQPNVFIDPKSSESSAPYYSNGTRDDLIQRRFIETLLDYWSKGQGRNPVSSVYGAPMLDLSHCQVWTWDARPYPEFPVREDIWSDGANWGRGHWLTGRAGTSSLARIIADIADRAGLPQLDTQGVDGILSGFVIDQPRRARDVIDQLGGVFGFDIIDRSTGSFALPINNRSSVSSVSAENLSSDKAISVIEFERAPYDEQLSEVRLSLIGDDGEYRPIHVSAKGLDGQVDGVVSLSLPALSDRKLARHWAQDTLSRVQQAANLAKTVFPPSMIRFETGDVISLDTGPLNKTWRLTALEGQTRREGVMQGVGDTLTIRAGSQPQGLGDRSASLSRPIVHVMDLPLSFNDTKPRNGVVVAAWSSPWPGSITLYSGYDKDNAEQRAVIKAPSSLGVLTEDLPAGPQGRWDYASLMKVKLYNGALHSQSVFASLAGKQALAIETLTGWQVITFQNAQLDTHGIYHVGGLLRQPASATQYVAKAGSPVVVLTDPVETLSVPSAEWSVESQLYAVPAGRALKDNTTREVSFIYQALDHRPLAPVHVRSRWHRDGLVLSWIRRGRIQADNWSGLDIVLGEDTQLYRVRIYAADGAVLRDEQTASSSVFLSHDWLDRHLPLGFEGVNAQIVQLGTQYGLGERAHAELNPVFYG